MPSYVAFLRAVNVGRRKVLMAELREWLTGAGYVDVETYIQSGNISVSSPARSAEVVEGRLEALLRDRLGFEVPTVVLTPAELGEVYAAATGLPPLLDGDGLRRYVTFLKAEPAADAAAELDAWDEPGERVRVLGRTVHWWLLKPTHQAKLSNARLERTLGPGTTRDLKVVATLAERWGA